MKNLLKVDFHCHSCYSPDSFAQLRKLISLSHKKGIDRLVISDHNTICGALHAKNIDPDLIVIGEEIQTNKGELQAFFVKREIPSGLSPIDVINDLRKQDAFISISHPFDPQRSGWTKEDLSQLVPLVDAIEVFNARCLSNSYNEEANNFAVASKLAGIAGSDAHTYREIGNVINILPQFSNAKELRIAILENRISGTLSPAWIHMFSLFARIFKKLRI